MSDMAATIIPKSDQLNADDLLAGPRTITIREMNVDPGTEQPVKVFFNGDNGKPYLPCKSMRRVMVALWGPYASAYAGRSMTLYRDPDVTWGGMAVGGIRISHMSHIDKVTVVVLTATKKARKPFTVAPLVVNEKPAAPLPAATPDAMTPREMADAVIAKINKAPDEAGLHLVAGAKSINRMRDMLKEHAPELDQEIADAMALQFQRLRGEEAAA